MTRIRGGERKNESEREGVMVGKDEKGKWEKKIKKRDSVKKEENKQESKKQLALFMKRIQNMNYVIFGLFQQMLSKCGAQKWRSVFYMWFFHLCNPVIMYLMCTLSLKALIGGVVIFRQKM